MRVSAIVVAVVLLGVAVSAQIGVNDPHRLVGVETQTVQARHEHDVTIEQERLLTAAVQVLSDEGYRVTRVDENDSTVTTDWAYMRAWGNRAWDHTNPAHQDRFIVSLDSDEKTVRLKLQTRSRDSGLDRLPRADKDKAETALALIVKTMEAGPELARQDSRTRSR